jgi:hypothetical protein
MTDFLDIIHRYIFIHSDVSEAILYLRPQAKSLLRNNLLRRLCPSRLST